MPAMVSTVARLAADEPTARRLAAALGESLDDAVCAAFEEADGRWQVAIHFGSAPNEAALRALVREVAGGAAAAALSLAPVEDADWVAQSLAGLKPVRAGRFVLHGAHDRARVPPNAVGIEIEAALAFGTGHHGTTRGCLMALDELLKRRRSRRVLDLGTGSGVLAIAAARTLHTKIVASDIDRVAVASARGNARLNRGGAITFLRADDTRTRTIAASAPYDLIFANILLGPLIRLAVPVRKLTAPRARVVLSGLLPAHANAVLSIYRAQGLMLERRLVIQGWVTLVLRRGCPRR
jgi:ribosomal protein L11 methyltransferase